MKESIIGLSRLQSQQIIHSTTSSPREIVSWMGAMQAQDYNMSKWAIGIRHDGITQEMVNEAINDSEIIRIHVLRPTWHWVASEDVRWMLELNAKKLVRSQTLRDKQLEITAAGLRKFYKLLEKSLRDHRYRTREETLGILKQHKIAIHDNRASHLFFHAEQAGILCNGPIVNNKQTLALLAERVPEGRKLEGEEARATLAAGYFKSHGPATLADFTWWSGLTITQATKALEAVKNELDAARIADHTYWWSGSVVRKVSRSSGIFLLPAFDEYIISYKNRLASLSGSDHVRAISTNGIFRPVIVVNGQIVGLWKREMIHQKLQITLDYFRDEGNSKSSGIEKAAKKLSRFHGMNDHLIAENPCRDAFKSPATTGRL